MSDKGNVWVLFTHKGSKASGRLRRKLTDSRVERWAVSPGRKTMVLVKKGNNFRRYLNKLAKDFNSEYVVMQEVLPSELRELPCGAYVYDTDDQRRNSRWAGHQANCLNCLALSPNETKAKRRRLSDGSANGANGLKPQGDEPTPPPEASDAMKALRSTQRIIVGGTGEFNALLTLVKSLGDEALMIATECDKLVSALANLAGAEDRINDLKGQMSKHRETLNQLLEREIDKG